MNHPTAPLSRREMLHRAAVLGLVSLPLVRGTGLAQTTGGQTTGRQTTGGQTTRGQATPAPPTPPAPGAATDYKFSLAALPAVTLPQDVSARKGNRAAWPQLTGVSIAQVEIPQGGWRAPHYHTNAPELAVIVQGRAAAGLQPPGQDWLELQLEAGDCVYFPLGWPHWLRNTGGETMHTYFNYGHEQPVTVELSG